MSFLTFHISTTRSVASQPGPFAPPLPDGVGVGAVGAPLMLLSA